MYYVYLMDNHDHLFVTDVRKANRIPLYSSPFLSDVVRKLTKLESKLGLQRGSSDLADVWEAFQKLLLPQEVEKESAMELF